MQGKHKIEFERLRQCYSILILISPDLFVGRVSNRQKPSHIHFYSNIKALKVYP